MPSPLIRYLAGKAYRPLLVKYLSRTRRFTRNGLSLDIPPQVFHPGFFFSTGLLLKAIGKLPLAGKAFLELGAGSGYIAMQAARRGAAVTATDINPIAIEYLEKNSLRNRVNMQVIRSDLFEHIPPQAFDIIAINPPYYRKDPRTPAEHAWFCGSNGEYFSKLFSQLPAYLHEHTTVLMVLCDGCDMRMIHDLAASQHFVLNSILEKKTLLETNYVFRIEKSRMSLKNLFGTHAVITT